MYTGSHFRFYAAVWDGRRIRVESLTCMFDLVAHRGDQTRVSFASAIDALLAAFKHMQAHYRAIRASLEHVDGRFRKYPYLVSVKKKDDTDNLSFTYQKQLDSDKLVFTAVPSPDGKQLLVQFTRQYSEDVHRLLSHLRLAPTLHCCVRIPGDRLAVVMDMSEYDLVRETSHPSRARKCADKKAKYAIKMLHEGGYVRPPNILVNPSSLSGSPEVVELQLIDFDWAERIGEATYPAGINTVSVTRPDGVEAGALVTKEHDEEMMLYLFPIGVTIW